MSKRMGQIDTINFVFRMHAKYDVRKHNVPICMVNENGLANELWSVLSRE